MGKIKRPSIFRHKDGTMLTKKEEEAAEMKYAILIPLAEEASYQNLRRTR